MVAKYDTKTHLVGIKYRKLRHYRLLVLSGRQRTERKWNAKRFNAWVKDMWG